MADVFQMEARLRDFISGKFTEMERTVSGSSARLQASAKKTSIATAKLGTTANTTGSQLRAFATRFGPAALAVGTLTAAIIKLRSITAFVTESTTTFEKTMSHVKAITEATAAEFAMLSERAKELGSSTVFTASQAGQAFVELGKLGFKTNQILEASESVLNLAAASQSELATASEIAAGTMKAFGMRADQVGQITDVMAKSFTTSALNLDRYAAAMSNVGPAARKWGDSIERTTALMGILVDNKIEASKAGTDYRKIIAVLAKEGLTLEEALEKINTSTNKVRVAQEMFGQRAFVSALILSDNIEKIGDYTEELKNSEGAARKMADTMLDNVAGATTLLKSAQEGLAIAIGETFSAEKKEFIKAYAKEVQEATKIIEAHREEVSALGEMWFTAKKNVLDKISDWFKEQVFKVNKFRVEMLQLQSAVANLTLKFKEVFNASLEAGGLEGVFETDAAVANVKRLQDEMDTLKQKSFDALFPELAEKAKKPKQGELAEKPAGLPVKAGEIRKQQLQKNLEEEAEIKDIHAIRDQEREEALIERKQKHREMELDLMLNHSAEVADIVEKSNEGTIRLEEKKLKEIEKRREASEKKAIRASKLRDRAEQRGKERLTDALVETSSRGLQAMMKNEKDAQKIALIASIVQGFLAVQRALAFPPGPPATIPSAQATGVLAALNTAMIASQAFAEGGLITKPTLALMGENAGTEGVLNPYGLARLGVGNFNALNTGRSVEKHVTNEISYSPTINVGADAGQDVINALDEDKPRFGKWIREEVFDKGY